MKKVTWRLTHLQDKMGKFLMPFDQRLSQRQCLKAFFFHHGIHNNLDHTIGKFLCLHIWEASETNADSVGFSCLCLHLCLCLFFLGRLQDYCAVVAEIVEIRVCNNNVLIRVEASF